MKMLMKSKTRQHVRKAISCLLAFLVINGPVWAITAGSTNNAMMQNAVLNELIENVSTKIDINNARAIIDWNNMDTDTGELLRFQLSGGGNLTSAYAVLNRISGNPTQFLGKLEGGSGHIIMINPKGITFGPNAVIEAGRFTASTMHLQMSDDQFLAENENFSFAKDGGDTAAQIALLAGSSVNAQRVDLLAQQIINEGTITTGNGGIVVMAAGESIYLGGSSSKVIVEMTGADGGMVTNAGTIQSPDGKIVLAAGDIYSVPLHPQLEIDKNGDPIINGKYPVRVESGLGSVVQSGTITANGANGEVILTAGDDVTLTSGSTTSSVGGKITTYAYDFGDLNGTTYFDSGATINIGDGEAEINGNHIRLAGNINASAGATIYVDPVTLTIADVVPLDGPEMDTLYRQWIENYSNAGVNLDLAADQLITVEYMSSGINGGSGDITLRNVYDDGGILFLANASGQRTKMHTRAGFETGGGDISMIAGSGGIVAGDILTDKLANDKVSNPGRILLLTTNGGDIIVGSMIADGGNISEISAISSGSMTVYGPVISTNKAVPKEEKEIGFARICLVAMDDIVIDAEKGSISVSSHGKFTAVADIIICAGKDVTIYNLGKDGINAYAQTSENTKYQTSFANVDIVAGSNKTGAGSISINGTTYDSTPGADNSKLPIFLETKVSGAGQPLRIDTSNPAVAGDPGELIWQDTKAVAGNYEMAVRLTINNDSQDAPGEPGSPCVGCPTPPGLPPVPHIFFLLDDEFTASWRAGNIEGFDPEKLDVLLNDGIKFDPTTNIVNYSMTTDKGGTLQMVWMDDLGAYGFLYTPSTDQQFVWDGVSDFASFSDTFTYQATKEVNGQTVLSKNTASVELVVTNYLPVLYGAEDTIHMNDTSSFTLTTVTELPDVLAPNTAYIVDSDGTPGDTLGTYGTLNYHLVEGLIPVFDGSITTDSVLIPDTLTIDGQIITYSPLEGYVSPTDMPTTFGYSVTDSSIVDALDTPVQQTENLEVTVTNALPGGAVTLDNAHMDTNGQELSVNSGDFTDTDMDNFVISNITKAVDDYNKTFGGTLDYNGDNDPYNEDVDGTYIYDADASLPGYVGEDNFDVQLWDGQRTYYADGTSEVLSTDYGTGTIALNVTNELPSGSVVLENAPMNADNQELAVDSGAFADNNNDDFVIVGIDKAVDDYNQGFGGTLDYNGSNDPYNAEVDDTYTYRADPLLPGYTGEDKFDVKLWDGQISYVFKEVDGAWVVDLDNTEPVYGSGTISLEITNQLPGGDAWFGQVHMDSQNVTQDLAVAFGDGVTVADGNYTGSVIGSTLYGGTLVYDGTNWTYSTDTDLPGYVGDDNDQYGTPGYIADDLFTVNLSSSAGQQYDYWFSEGPAPEGYDYYEPADIYRKAISGTGTVSVDLINESPIVVSDDIGLHMNDGITGKNLANDVADSLGILDAIKLYDVYGNPLGNGDTITLDSGTVTLIAHETDGKITSYTFEFEPKDGYVGGPVEFVVKVSDGEKIYAFNNETGEIKSAVDVIGDGTVKITLFNNKPTADGDLGSVESGDTPLVLDQIGNVPVTITDVWDAYQKDNDDLTIIPGTYDGNFGGKLVFDGTQWTYTPADGFTGTETFAILVWDGENIYVNGDNTGPAYGAGQVTVTVTTPPPGPTPEPEPTPTTAIASLPILELPKYQGCPVEMQAAANELGVSSDSLQIMFYNALASNPNIQPCDACASLMSAAMILSDIDGARLAAMNQIFNTLAPVDAPFTPEVSASVVTAFAQFGTEDSQYALATEYVDAFVQYVAVLNELKTPLGDAVAFTLEKHGSALSGEDINPNITAYIMSQLMPGEEL